MVNSNLDAEKEPQLANQTLSRGLGRRFGRIHVVVQHDTNLIPPVEGNRKNFPGGSIPKRGIQIESFISIRGD